MPCASYRCGLGSAASLPAAGAAAKCLVPWLRRCCLRGMIGMLFLPFCRLAHAQPPRAFLQNLFRGLGGKQQQQQPLQRRMSREEAAVSRLLIAVEGSERGLSGDEQQRAEIMAAVEELKELGSGSTTTGAAELSATWRLLWTTEKE